MRPAFKSQQLERPLTPSSLERSALWHLGRRALTTTELRDRLQKKARRHPEHPESGAWIEALVLRLSSSLLLDDAKVAKGRVDSARARGWSRRRIEQKLRGVDVDVKDQAFAAVDDASSSEADLAAAVIYAQKKRLSEKDPRKALASLARQGFSFSIAKAALKS
jgi:SOS response regulatory protein OraA/RecX